MTTSTEVPTPSAHAKVALQRFVEQERARLLLGKKEKALHQALLSMDRSDDSADLAWYYEQTQQVIERNDLKAEALGVAL
jgi:hypothetical protein